MSEPADRTIIWRWLAVHLAAVLVVGITAIVLGIIMAISYAHEVELASRNGQSGWASALIPFAVDGMLVVASIALWWAGQNGISRPVPPLVTGGVGIVATVGANFVSDQRAGWLGPAVAGSVGVAAVLVGWVASWLIETQRKLANAEPDQPTRTTEQPTRTITKRTTAKRTTAKRTGATRTVREPELGRRAQAALAKAEEVDRIVKLVRNLDTVPKERAIAESYCGGSRRLARDVLAQLAHAPAAEGDR